MRFIWAPRSNTLTKWWGLTVDIDFYFFEASAMAGWVGGAGFRVEEQLERDPYPDVEAPTRRLYLSATKPLDAT